MQRTSRILVINAGSSSLKHKLLDMRARQPLASGIVERIGEARPLLRYETFTGDQPRRLEQEVAATDHASAMALVMDLMRNGHGDTPAVMTPETPLDGVAHRVVHGGERFSQPTLITDESLQSMRDCIPLAPLHNPANIAGVEVARALLPNIPHVAIFDTAYHQTMTPETYRYAIPPRFYEEHGVRRYGFHGASHEYVCNRLAALLERPLETCNLITAHLGNGASVSAMRQGRPADISLGMTPVSGLVMGSRCGDMDPAVPAIMARQEGASHEEIERIMNHESGLRGLAGSNDLRDVHDRVRAGDENARLALGLYTRRVAFYIAAFAGLYGPVHGVAFTAGVGENDAAVRAMSLAPLEHMGLRVDNCLNESRERGERRISLRGAIPVYVIPTNEEWQMALGAQEVIQEDAL